MNICDVSTRWLESIRHTVKESTYSCYLTLIQKHILTYFNNNLIITSEHIQQFINYKITNDLSPASVRNIVVLLERILRYGEDENLLNCASEREIPIISLSGNPFGVAVSIELLIRPALEKMMQDPSIGLKEVNGIMADNFEKGIKGRRFIRAYLENGKFHLPNGLHSNGVLSSMAGCNCLIDTKTMENQESRSLNAGDKVGAILL